MGPRDCRGFRIEMQFRKIHLEILWKVASILDDFMVMGSFFQSFSQSLDAATEKVPMPMLSLVLGTKRCCVIDDQSCMGIFERCQTLAN